MMIPQSLRDISLYTREPCGRARRPSPTMALVLLNEKKEIDCNEFFQFDAGGEEAEENCDL